MKKAVNSKSYARFAQWLKDERLARSITMKELGEMLEVPHSLVQNVESAERRLDVFEYCQWCEVLDLDPMEGISILKT